MQDRIGGYEWVSARAPIGGAGGEDLDERGRLPEAHMPIFWEIAKRTGDVTEPWPKEKFLDSRFIESYDQWKP